MSIPRPSQLLRASLGLPPEVDAQAPAAGAEDPESRVIAPGVNGCVKTGPWGTRIYEWSGDGQGNTRAALRSLPAPVCVVDPGEPGSASFAYWTRMHSEALVHRLEDDLSVEILVPAAASTPARRPRTHVFRVIGDDELEHEMTLDQVQERFGVAGLVRMDPQEHARLPASGRLTYFNLGHAKHAENQVYALVPIVRAAIERPDQQEIPPLVDTRGMVRALAAAGAAWYPNLDALAAGERHEHVLYTPASKQGLLLALQRRGGGVGGGVGVGVDQMLQDGITVTRFAICEPAERPVAKTAAARGQGADMGFFSWRCAHTGLPIMANARSERSIPGQFHASRVTVLYQAGIRTEGIYDGYGRLATPDGQEFYLQEEIDRHDARLVLSDLCRDELKVKPGDLTRPSRFWDTLKPNEADPNDGFFLDGDFARRMFSAKLSALQQPGVYEDIDGMEYPARVCERSMLEAQLLAEAGKLVGITDTSTVYAVDELFGRFMDAHPSEREDLASQMHNFALKPPLGVLPPFMAAAAITELLAEVTRRVNVEVIAAWREGRAAKPVPALDVLTGQPAASKPRATAQVFTPRPS